MRGSTRTRKGLALAGAVAILPASVLLLGSNATGSTNAHTLRFLEKPATFKFLDTPPLQGADAPPSAGDGFIFTSKLFRGGERVGILHAHCLVTRGRSDPSKLPLLCDGVIDLRRGNITGTTLTRSGAERTVIAITGGTGRFAGAEGTILESPAGGGNQHLVVRLIR